MNREGVFRIQLSDESYLLELTTKANAPVGEVSNIRIYMVRVLYLSRGPNVLAAAMSLIVNVLY